MKFKFNLQNPFKPYENKHEGSSAILFGSGPSILNFDATKVHKGVLRFGVNDQIFLNLGLDYWFMGDAMPQIPSKFYDRFEEFDDYLPNEQKFVRYCNWNDEREITVPGWGKVPRNGQLPELKYTKYYVANSGGNPDQCTFKKDISEGDLSAVASITFEVLQFMLYCGIKKIYLVGQDCDYTNGTFRGYKIGLAQGAGPCILRYWKVVTNWLEKHYPHVEIYSVNPVGLNIFPEVKASDIR